MTATPQRIVVALLAVLAGARALDNGLLLTPPMGWMSWTAFYCEMDCVAHPNACINEQLYQQMADAMVSGGYLDAGYDRVHVDDCWMERDRDANGILVANATRFPSGMKGLADYMHTHGLLFGTYEDYGTLTCGGFAGSFGHLKTDAQSFANWTVDYLKLDGCYADTDDYPIGYPEMSQRLNETGRPIAYSCSWPAYLLDSPDLVNYTVIGKYCNLWRNYYDISSSWTSIKRIIDYYDLMQDKHIPTHGPGHWHDPDMIVAGNPGVTLDQAKVQLAIWSIWSAPLIMSNDLRTIGPEFKEILLNKRVIAVDQDPLGVMGRLTVNTTYIAIYVKKMTPYQLNTYSYAIASLNRNNASSISVNFLLKDLGLTSASGYQIQDLWSGQITGNFLPTDRYNTTVNATGVDLIKATPLDLL